MFKWVLRATGVAFGLLLMGMFSSLGYGHLRDAENLTVGLQMMRGRLSFHRVDVSTRVTFEVVPPIAWRRQFGFSPDGRRVLIFSASADFQTQSFHIYDLHHRREIYRDSTLGQKPGDIFILRRYDDFSPVWSPDSRHIAFRHPGGDGLYIIDLHTQASTQIFERAAVTLDERAWSPDGERLAFVAEGNVYVIRRDGTDLHNLTADLHPAYAPQWSPDGERIAFFETHTEQPNLYAYITQPVPGALPVNISAPVGDGYSPQWSPDGEWLLFFSGRVGFNQAYTLHLASGQRYALNDHPEHNLQGLRAVVWSPDSRKLALEVLKAGSLSRTALYLATPTGDEIRLLAEEGRRPIWSPDSRRLAYALPPLPDAHERRLGSALYVIDLAQAQPPLYLTNDGQNLMWSRDGRYLTLVDYAGRGINRLLQVDARTGAARVLLSSAIPITDYAYWR